MTINLIFRIAAVGILVSVLGTVLKHSGRDEQAFLVSLAGAIPKSVPEDIYEQFIERISGKNVNVVVDATKELLLNVLKYRPFLIKPNNHELAEMFGKTSLDEDDRT